MTNLGFIVSCLFAYSLGCLFDYNIDRKISPSLDIKHVMLDEHPPSVQRQRQTGIARTGVCHGCEVILLRRWRDWGRQRHIEADAEKCERVSVRLVMTRSWLRRAGEAAALALTHLIPTGPPAWRHSACAVAFLCFNFFVSSSHTWASHVWETLKNVHLSIYLLYIYMLSNYPSIYLSIYRAIYPSILYIYIYLLSIYPSINQCISISIYPSIYPFVYLSIYLTIYLSKYPSICLSICLSV